MKKPPKVGNRYIHWGDPQPELSERCIYWIERICFGGFTPNRRLRVMGYDEASEFYGVYIWEYINVLSKLLREVAE